MDWRAEHERAFLSVKDALAQAPVLGHPVQGKPYRLYTDASGEGLGCTLQQAQPIAIRDLVGTRVFDKLRQYYESGRDPPRLVAKLSDKIIDYSSPQPWAPKFEDTLVEVERVIAYWSRTFKGPETRYHTTEREALAAKEGLVKFQPFIEGEQVLLITDHSALQWAKTYEDSNRRLASWGLVFSAYAPNLQIIHRPGRVHSNVDPLSRLLRHVPVHIAPLDEDSPAIRVSRDTDKFPKNEPAERFAGFVAHSWSDCLNSLSTPSAFAVLTRSRTARDAQVRNGGGIIGESCTTFRASGRRSTRQPQLQRERKGE